MQIYVCVKHVPDTAARITVVGGSGFAETCKFIVNPYDEYAVEEAVQLVKRNGGEVVIVTVGKETAVSSMRSALAMGADRGILVKTDAQFLDSALTAQALKKAIAQDGTADLIFCGRQSIDSEGMQTPFRLAQAFGMAVVTDVVALSVNENQAIAEHDIGGGTTEVLQIQLPCVIGANRGLNDPPYPKLPQVLRAKKKEIKQVDIADLGLDLSFPLTEIIKIEAVPERGKAKIFEGSTRESVEQLVKALKEEEKIL
jgi:electron transfer flavoprotein beta subunit